LPKNGRGNASTPPDQAGRPRSPLGLLRALIVMRMKEMRSLRELTRVLDVDRRIRRLCLTGDGERGYPRSVLSRFTTLFGAEKLGRMIRNRVEAAYAFLKTRYGMAVNRVRGLGRVAVYALYSVLCHVLTREAAENIGRPDKAVSPTFFNT